MFNFSLLLNKILHFYFLFIFEHHSEEHADDVCDVATHLLIWQTSPTI